MAGIRKVLDLLGRDGADVAAVSHGTTVATNQLLEGKVGDLGFITTEGYEFRARDRPAVGARRLRQLLLLGEAAADRARPTGCAPSAAGSTSSGAEVRPFDEARRGRGRPVVPRRRHRHHRRLLPALLRRRRATSWRCARCCAREHPDAVVSISQRGAARVPRVRAVGDHAGRRGGEAARSAPYVANIRQPAATRSRPDVPFYVMKTQRRRAVGRARSCTSRSPRCCPARPPARSGAALVAGDGRASTGCSPATAAARRPTSSVVLDGEPTLTTEGTVGALPVARSR